MAASILTPVVGPVKMLRNARMAGSLKLRCGADLCLACRLWAVHVGARNGKIKRGGDVRGQKAHSGSRSESITDCQNRARRRFVRRSIDGLVDFDGVRGRVQVKPLGSRSSRREPLFGAGVDRGRNLAALRQRSFSKAGARRFRPQNGKHPFHYADADLYLLRM